MNQEPVDLMPYNMWLVSSPFIVQQTTSLPQMTSLPQSVQSSTPHVMLSKDHAMQFQSNNKTQSQTTQKSYHPKSPTLLYSPQSKKNMFPNFPQPHISLTGDDQRSTPIKHEYDSGSGVQSNGIEPEVFPGSPILSKTVCKTCGKWFRSRQQLTQHQLVHSDVRKYKCNYCDRAFKQPSHLQQHHRIHTGEKPYRCPLEGCIRAFPQLSNLNHHLRNHDKPDPPTENTCRFCGRTYASEAVLKNHMLKIHINGDSAFGDATPTASGDRPAPNVPHLDHVTKSMLMEDYKQILTTANDDKNKEMIMNMQHIFNIPPKKLRLSEEELDQSVSPEQQFKREFSPSGLNGSSLPGGKFQMPLPLRAKHPISPEDVLHSELENIFYRQKGALSKIVPGNGIINNESYNKFNLNDYLHEIRIRENYNYTLDTIEHGIHDRNISVEDRDRARTMYREFDMKANDVGKDHRNIKTENTKDRNDRYSVNEHHDVSDLREHAMRHSVRFDQSSRYETYEREIENARLRYEEDVSNERSRDEIRNKHEELDHDSDSQEARQEENTDNEEDEMVVSEYESKTSEKHKMKEIQNNVITSHISNSRKRKAFHPQRVVHDHEALDFSA